MEKTALESGLFIFCIIVATFMLLIWIDTIRFSKSFNPKKWFNDAESNSNASKQSQPKPDFKSSGYRAERKASK